MLTNGEEHVVRSIERGDVTCGEIVQVASRSAAPAIMLALR
jgi:hypothetical protein